jgi:hypothetical protein
VTIACTLQDGDRSDREREWAEFLATCVRRVERVTDLQLRLALDLEAADVVLRAVDLASREKACCEFFEFSLAIGVTDRWLEVEVPPDGAFMLDGFAELSGPRREHTP